MEASINHENELEHLRWLCHTKGINSDGELDGDILAADIYSAGFRKEATNG